MSFSDEDFTTALRFRLGQHLCLEGQRCSNTYATPGPGHRSGDRCGGWLDAAGNHATNCFVGGRRKHTHDTQRDLWAQQLPGAGYLAHREQHVPGWDRWVRQANGRWRVQRAILNLRLEAPPDAPITYVDVVVTHPTSAAYRAEAARENGYAAAKAEEGKHVRYPENGRVRGRLVALAVETYGGLGEEGLRFLRRAAERACYGTTVLAALRGEGPQTALGAWLQRQSVALQKSNAAAVKAAAGATPTAQEHPVPDLNETALDVLASAEHLAALAA
ncbi:MAG: hypothetical protein VX403_05420 [Planctomycetota bacterium]|nr:hypothetical protein [Planctomycetota bacterium]